MLSISILGAGKELILSVVDNGDSIPSTIFSRHPLSVQGSGYTKQVLTVEQIGQITDFATHPGITRKIGPLAEKAGMGLTYIKEDTVKIFGGSLSIVSDGAKVSYRDKETSPSVAACSHPWRGNLLRIAIPLPSPSTHAGAPTPQVSA